MPVATIGIGSNLGDSAAVVEQALLRLGEIGTFVARSSLYRTLPWGQRAQPPFINAVVRLDTTLGPHALLAALQRLEGELGRTPGEHWGPRMIDLDIVTYGDAAIDEAGLQIPHPHLRERAFVLVPLAEIDPAYALLRDALAGSELESVMLLRNGLAPTHRETEARMFDDSPRSELIERVRAAAELLEASDLVRLRIVRGGDEIEVCRMLDRPDVPSDLAAIEHAPPARLDTISADVVGIFRLSRPAANEGDLLDEDRDLAYVEALGIRNAVRSRGPGRIVSILRVDGDPVEYGQPLFEIDRGA